MDLLSGGQRVAGRGDGDDSRSGGSGGAVAVTVRFDPLPAKTTFFTGTRVVLLEAARSVSELVGVWRRSDTVRFMVPARPLAAMEPPSAIVIFGGVFTGGGVTWTLTLVSGQRSAVSGDRRRPGLGSRSCPVRRSLPWGDMRTSRRDR